MVSDYSWTSANKSQVDTANQNVTPTGTSFSKLSALPGLGILPSVIVDIYSSF